MSLQKGSTTVKIICSGRESLTENLQDLGLKVAKSIKVEEAQVIVLECLSTLNCD